MTDYTELVKALRYCTDNEPSNGDCWNCPYRGEKCHTLLSNAAAAIEELSANVADKDYLIEQQTNEIQRLMADVKRQQEKMIELAKRLPKRGQYVHGRELSREYIGDCLVSIDYEDWRCSVCGIVFEQWSIPKHNYCPNCGAKMMEVQE